MDFCLNILKLYCDMILYHEDDHADMQTHMWHAQVHCLSRFR